MRKLYQTEWHHIPFRSFARPSSTELATSSFYERFYEVFFEKYRDWGELDEAWVRLKLLTMEFIYGHPLVASGKSILSVGCGIGIIEKALLDKGLRNLEVTEVSVAPLRWLLPHLSSEKVHIGFFPGCVPKDKRFDFIYLSSVEYFLDDVQFVGILKAVKRYLLTNGVCLILSTAFESETATTRRQIALDSLKGCGNLLLEVCGFRKKKEKQFWGFLRNKTDFAKAMALAGYLGIRDGFVDTESPITTYWIEGMNE
jgi:SAM-dependent methyltransferase